MYRAWKGLDWLLMKALKAITIWSAVQRILKKKPKETLGGWKAGDSDFDQNPMKVAPDISRIIVVLRRSKEGVRHLQIKNLNKWKNIYSSTESHCSSIGAYFGQESESKKTTEGGMPSNLRNLYYAGQTRSFWIPLLERWVLAFGFRRKCLHIHLGMQQFGVGGKYLFYSMTPLITLESVI